MRVVPIGSAVAALAAALAGGGVAATAPSSAPAAGAICSAVPDGAALVVADSSGVAIERTAGSERLSLPAFAAPPTLAVRGPDGTVWVETPSVATETVEGPTSEPAGDRPPADVFRAAPGSSEAVEAATGEVMLMSAGWLDGRTAATIVDFSDDRDTGNEETFGAKLIDFADGEQREVGPAGGIEYGVNSLTIGAGRIVEGAYADLTEAFGTSDPEGTRYEDWPSPISSDQYNRPPLYQWPVASIAPGATTPTWSWVEGPDWDLETEQRTGGWSLVIADPATGAESLRLDLGEPGDWLLHADFDGRFWVGTFADDTSVPDTSVPDSDGAVPNDPARVLIVDTAAAEPAVTDAGCAAGIAATLDRNGTPAPPPVPAPTSTTGAPTTVPPTTAAPTTAAPTTVARCTYVEADNAYPFRTCDKGSAVRAIQEQINKRGQTIDADGYFGPGTEQAVRNFQQAAGLEVDGLVGPDTWAALYTGDPAGTDADGNGTVDPWELGSSDAPAGWVGSTYPYPQFDTSGDGGSAGSAEIGGVTVWAAWSVELEDSPAPYYYAMWLLPGGSERTLLLGRTDGDTAADPTAMVTIVEAVNLSVADGTVPALRCTYDGSLDPSVVAAVTVDYSGPTVTFPVHAAWRLASGGETIQPIETARVSCEDGIPIVD